MNLTEGDRTRLKSLKFYVAIDLVILPLGIHPVKTTRHEDKDYHPFPQKMLTALNVSPLL